MSDKDLLKNRFAANLRSYNSLAVVQERICEELAELIGTHVPGKITRGLEVGTGTGFLTPAASGALPRRRMDAERSGRSVGMLPAALRRRP